MKSLLDRFAKKTMNFIKNNDSEIMAIKNTVTRSLTAQDRKNEAELKAFKVNVDKGILEIKDEIDDAWKQTSVKMEEVDDKLSRVDDTKDVMDRLMIVINN